ncbi:hypothetical protein MLD38_005934 [Melastoma candidum]|uniref:Uncharacterized protein n=1 Tax=Melastoma candidum TaxID=119954 RepID=A0ACB9RLA7_9MYRT|nr:hypothetical protein MLD38_005934 [Melastoma candidum]
MSSSTTYRYITASPLAKLKSGKARQKSLQVAGLTVDGITVYGSGRIWIDHCTLSYCADGLIDVTEGSTGVTISNNLFSHHDKVMLLGHSDDFTDDKGNAGDGGHSTASARIWCRGCPDADSVTSCG